MNQKNETSTDIANVDGTEKITLLNIKMYEQTTKRR